MDVLHYGSRMIGKAAIFLLDALLPLCEIVNTDTVQDNHNIYF